MSSNLAQTIKPLLFLLGQGILWLAALLAVLGRLWRPQNDAPDLLAAVSLALVVELLVTLTFPRRPGFERFPSRWIPVLLLGFLFPVRALLLYLVTITVLEGTRRRLLPFIVKARCAERPNADSFVDSFSSLLSEYGKKNYQTIQRYRTADNRDCLDALLTVEFAEGQKNAAVHLPFCPMFQAAPTIDTTIKTNLSTVPDAAVTDISVQPFGVRIEVRRPPSPPTEIQLLIHAEEVLDENRA